MTNEAILGILDNLCNEVRNSMHAVFGLLELPGDAAPDGRWQSCVEIGRASADRLLRAIDDVRELLAGIPAAPDACGEFDLSVCLRETVELLNLAHGVEGAIFLGAASAAAMPVRQDRHGVEQVLMRVLSAAGKLSAAGGVRIEETVFPDGFRLTIEIPDAGAAERLQGWLNVEPDQACFPNPVEVPLAVAVMAAGKRIRAMGGAATVAEGDDAPPRLVVTLPMAPAAAPGPEGAQRQHQIRPEGLNVLMVEDCDDSYALSELLLRDENVWRAATGRAAFELVKQRRFDVVFMDVHMPGIDGYMAMHAIRDWETETGNARTPIVVLSSDDLATQQRFAAQAGCSGFLRKPLRNAELLGLLDRLKMARSPMV